MAKGVHVNNVKKTKSRTDANRKRQNTLKMEQIR